MFVISKIFLHKKQGFSCQYYNAVNRKKDLRTPINDFRFFAESIPMGEVKTSEIKNR